MENKKGLLNKRIPTIIGILILVGGLVAGIFLVSKPQTLLTKAGPTALPKNVRTTNRGSDKITVSWITDTPVTGLVRYSDDPTKLNLPAGDTRDQISGTSGSFTTHYVEIANLVANKTYYYEIQSGSQTYNDNGRPYQIRTAAKSAKTAEDIISGKVATADGQGVEGAIVYLEIDGGETMSALTKNGGGWRLNLAEMVNAKGEVVAYDQQNQLLSIFIQGGGLGTATSLTSTGNDSPVADIVMGTNTNLVENKGAIGAGLVGTGSGKGGGFSGLAEGASGVSGMTEELLNPQTDKEKIATSSPEFRGKLTPGTSVKIMVNSTTEQTSTVVADESGVWAWTPPLELEPGEHTITIEYTDEGGILQTIKRSFTVLAADESSGLPAFTATPSATPTILPSATDSGATRSSMPATNSGIPEPGILTHTSWLLIVGVGLFISGLWGRYKFSKLEVKNK